METLSLLEARNLALFTQGYLFPSKKKATLQDVRQVISNLGVLQIDTINVIARSPYFCLWSRVGEYDPRWLEQLLEEKSIFEGWAHEASFLPVEDFLLHRRLVIERLRLPWYHGWYEKNKEGVDEILAHVRENGPVRSSDFKRQDGRVGTWWDWKFEKSALEYWFAAGELMIDRRINFQRVYDLRERVVPQLKDQDVPDLNTVYRQLIKRSIGALGFALPGWVADYFRLPKKDILALLQKMIDEGQFVQIQVEGWKESAWALPEVWEQFNTKKIRKVRPEGTTLLSPFDSLIFDRKRTKQLFNFDFAIECYLPAAKRKYGYFLVPILHEGELIGRLDAKAHRAEKIFEARAIYLEPGVPVTPKLAQGLAGALTRCAEWHKTPAVKISRCDPEELTESLLPILPQ